MARAVAAIELSDEEERALRTVLRTPSASQQQALRARIVLRAAEGATNTQIAVEAGVSLPTVGYGDATSPNDAWTGWPTRRGRAVRARSTTTRSSACWR